jgi:Cytochrome C and Quinol oxidase polypeptide I/Glycosyl hydrolases family 15
MWTGWLTREGAGRAGWYASDPLARTPATPGPGMDLWLCGAILATLGAILIGACVLSTIVRRRAPGMTMLRLPVFTWTALASCLLVVFAFPSLVVAFGLLLAERHGERILDPIAYAGVLLIAISGLLPADDPRMTSTIEVARGRARRRRPSRRWADAQDGAFLPASFWLAECHAQAGRLERAHEIFEQAAGAANDLGLLVEEVDLAIGEPLGNMPQALSHVGLVNAAQTLTQVERGAVPAGGAT